MTILQSLSNLWWRSRKSKPSKKWKKKINAKRWPTKNSFLLSSSFNRSNHKSKALSTRSSTMDWNSLIYNLLASIPQQRRSLLSLLILMNCLYLKIHSMKMMVSTTHLPTTNWRFMVLLTCKNFLPLSSSVSIARRSMQDKWSFNRLRISWWSHRWYLRNQCRS